MTDTKELCGANTSRGYNQTTAHGRAFYAADPRAEEVFIDDIAAQLSRVCRFGGALKDYVPAGYSHLGEQRNKHLEIYSVAQHSVLVADNVPEPFRLRALLHDAAEAYIGDMIKPIKLMMTAEHCWDDVEEAVHGAGVRRSGDFARDILDLVPCFKRLEAGVQRAIHARFGLPKVDEEADAAIAVADYRAVLTEHRDLQVNTGAVDWGRPTLEPFSERVVPLLPSEARALFLQRFAELYKGE